MLYRAKRIDKNTNEWVEGYIVRPHSRNENEEIVSFYFNALDEMGWAYECIVSADTVCRFTGLTYQDKKVWENDIVKYHFGEETAVIRFGKYSNVFDDKECLHVGFYVDWKEKYLRKDLGYWVEMIDCNIIGNAIDNPELLK